MEFLFSSLFTMETNPPHYLGVLTQSTLTNLAVAHGKRENRVKRSNKDNTIHMLLHTVYKYISIMAAHLALP